MNDSIRTIEKQINEVTLAELDAQTQLGQLLETLARSVQAQVAFLISSPYFPTGNWHDASQIDSEKLLKVQQQLQAILNKTSQQNWTTVATREKLLQLLQNQLNLDYNIILPLLNDYCKGILILSSDQDISFDQSINQSFQTTLSIALKTIQLQYNLERYRRYQTLKQQVSEVIHHSQELETILHSAIAHTCQALEVKRGMVLMLRYNSGDFFQNRELISSPNVKVQPLTQWAQTSQLETELNSFPLTESPSCLQAWQQAPSLLSQIEQPFNPSYEPATLAQPIPMPAWLMMPLMGKSGDKAHSQTVLGLLLLQHDQSRCWLEEEQQLVKWVSTEASTTIIQNKTIQRVQSLVDERTAQLQKSLDVQAKLYETSRYQVEQLQQLNQIKDDFLATISHELNTPLATMKMAIQMLRRSDLTSQQHERYLNILAQEWKREHELIEDLLTLQTIEDQGIPINVQGINLKQLLSELQGDFLNQWQEKGLNCQINYESTALAQQEITIYSDVESVKRIFWELLTNAGKYATKNTAVEILISQPSNQQIQVSVTNIGYGIAPAEQDYIFEQFRRGKGAMQKAIPGTGLGLALVNSLVKYLNGTIKLDSNYNPDGVGKTTFYVTLPQSLTAVSSEG